jgi:uncharacterized membrane protein YeaQ/YmgE (transglycosylase-associated protein family)
MARVTIPILQSVPDIINLYLTSPNTSFFIDALILSIFFGIAIKEPSTKMFKDTKMGPRFALILGLVLGVSATTALHQFGVTLLGYWMTALFAAIVVAIIVFSLLKKVGGDKFPWITIPLAALLGWVIFDGWIANSQFESVKGVSAILALIGPIIFLIVIIWLAYKSFGIAGHGATTIPGMPGGPTTPGVNAGTLFKWLSAPIWGPVYVAAQAAGAMAGADWATLFRRRGPSAAGSSSGTSGSSGFWSGFWGRARSAGSNLGSWTVNQFKNYFNRAARANADAQKAADDTIKLLSDTKKIIDADFEVIKPVVAAPLLSYPSAKTPFTPKAKNEAFAQFNAMDAQIQRFFNIPLNYEAQLEKLVVKLNVAFNNSADITNAAMDVIRLNDPKLVAMRQHPRVGPLMIACEEARTRLNRQQSDASTIVDKFPRIIKNVLQTRTAFLDQHAKANERISQLRANLAAFNGTLNPNEAAPLLNNIQQLHASLRDNLIQSIALLKKGFLDELELSGSITARMREQLTSIQQAQDAFSKTLESLTLTIEVVNKERAAQVIPVPTNEVKTAETAADNAIVTAANAASASRRSSDCSKGWNPVANHSSVAVRLRNRSRRSRISFKRSSLL